MTPRPPATLAAGLETLARIAPGRLVATLGAGDSQSHDEDVSFGLAAGTFESRVGALEAAVATTIDRGYPVWIGGASVGVGAVAAARTDGWNRWGGPLERFEAEARAVLDAHVRDPFTVSWAGLFVLGADEREARAKSRRLDVGRDATVGGPEKVAETLRDYAAAGAQWAIIGPVDSSDPDNAAVVGERVKPLLDA